ncbi:hypothetical protein J2W32_004484 [Variovorax boronicumulans]|uniref:Uncharacterized protein n=1 Tax=Variovorax boronicumulans TaxID=436515 RepID=A0AAW8D1N3_9BURK|nr:hypothetical protein [Variovorax boronicumulans]MDP9895386.1 hypothetical protein [Variovorax boronicumulans]MDQ0055426.1 hypothetical protein [Variovorax boronicumulans]
MLKGLPNALMALARPVTVDAGCPRPNPAAGDGGAEIRGAAAAAALIGPVPNADGVVLATGAVTGAAAGGEMSGPEARVEADDCAGGLSTCVVPGFCATAAASPKLLRRRWSSSVIAMEAFQGSMAFFSRARGAQTLLGRLQTSLRSLALI